MDQQVDVHGGLRLSKSFSLVADTVALRTPEHAAAVEALVACAVADHQGAALGARGRVRHVLEDLALTQVERVAGWPYSRRRNAGLGGVGRGSVSRGAGVCTIH